MPGASSTVETWRSDGYRGWQGYEPATRATQQVLRRADLHGVRTATTAPHPAARSAGPRLRWNASARRNTCSAPTFNRRWDRIRTGQSGKATSAFTTSATTPAQSPSHCWRNRRALGYPEQQLRFVRPYPQCVSIVLARLRELLARAKQGAQQGTHVCIVRVDGDGVRR